MIDRFIVAVFCVLMISSSFGQELQGTFVGRVISAPNVLVLSEVHGSIIGYLYLNSEFRIAVIGSSQNEELFLHGKLPLGREIVMEGKIKNDTLKIKYHLNDDSTTVESSNLVRHSGLALRDIRKIFPKGSNSLDLALVGKWNLVRQYDDSGKAVSFDFYSIVFLANGLQTVESNNLSIRLNELGISYNMRFTRWTTNGPLLISSFESHLLGTNIDFVQSYQINGDTLKIKNEKNTLYVFRKTHQQ